MSTADITQCLREIAADLKAQDRRYDAWLIITAARRLERP